MRKNEAIWIEKSQRWQIKVQKDGVRKAFYSTKVGRKGKIEAEKKADAWLESGEDGGRRRFDKVWEEWIAWQEQSSGKDNPTLKKNRSIGKTHVVPVIGWKQIQAIKLDDWQGVVDKAFAKKKLSKKTLENIRGALTSFYSYCKRKGLPICKPDEIIIPRAATRGERTILQPTDLDVLFTHSTITNNGKERPCWYIHYWRFAVYTGLRPGELVGLKWDDIRDGVLTISRSVNADGIETRGQNRNARRSIYLTTYALQELEEQRAMVKAAHIITPWVFPAPDGQRASERAIYKLWVRWSEQHKIPHTSNLQLRTSCIYTGG